MTLKRALLKLLLLALAAGFCTASHAVRCPALFHQEGAKDTFYALVFLDSASEEDRDRLSSEVSPLLTSIARKLATQSGAKRTLKVELIVCEYHLTGKDFSYEEMLEYMGYKVIAVFWKSQEGARPGLVQLAIPAYVKNQSALRRDVEVVTPYASTIDGSIDSWIEVFNQDNAPYKPFVSMGLAMAYQATGDYTAALTALCTGRGALNQLATNALRPKADAFDSEIATKLKDMSTELEASARRAGVKTIPPCAKPGAGPTH